MYFFGETKVSFFFNRSVVQKIAHHPMQTISFASGGDTVSSHAYYQVIFTGQYTHCSLYWAVLTHTVISLGCITPWFPAVGRKSNCSLSQCLNSISSSFSWWPCFRFTTLSIKRQTFDLRDLQIEITWKIIQFPRHVKLLIKSPWSTKHRHSE